MNELHLNKFDEVEILEFTLNNNHYGISVNLVREVLRYQPVTPVPKVSPVIEGIFMPRDEMITLIDLKNYLDLSHSEGNGYFIVANFEDEIIAFHVDVVVGIHRVVKDSIIPPGDMLDYQGHYSSLGLLKRDDKIIVLLNFDDIIKSLLPELEVAKDSA